MTTLLYLAFILSGAAGLIYESIWTRYLGLFVGHSAYAQIIVLVIFLGGMSLGAFVAGRRSDTLTRPLFWYAGVEAIVGVIGMIFHKVYVIVTGVAYTSIFPSLGGSATVTIAKWVLAALLILPQSILLGATFPLMSAGALRYVRATAAAPRTGRVLSLLYFANSIGAAFGVLLAGFYLIAASGLEGTLLAAAIMNLVVAIVVLMAARVRTMRAADRGEEAVVRALVGTPAPTDAGIEPVGDEARVPAPALWRAMLIVSFGTAVASFVYEISWIRMLSLVLGAATHSFELMLSAFILGLALGALWVRGRADTFRDPIRALGIVQWIMGSLAVATLPMYLASFTWMADMMQALAHNEAGYRLYSGFRYVVCLAVMLPATFCAGITLPLITRTLIANGSGERAIGAVYGVNTLGSIVGAAIAGLVVLPIVGLKWLLILGALVDVGLGIYLLAVVARSGSPAADSPRAAQRSRLATASAAIALLVIFTTAFTAEFDRRLLTSGVFRFGIVGDQKGRVISFYKDGRTATVSGTTDTVRKQFSLATNGKPDASLEAFWVNPFKGGVPTHRLTSDQSTQVLLPVVAMAYMPTAKTVAVIGHGSGVSTHTFLGNEQLSEVTTVEIEPQMINGARIFYPANKRAFDDPRSRKVIDDAKAYFAAAGKRYDIIMSEPSNPWVSGVSGLFTSEFYQRVRQYLTKDGVLGQWLHLYETDDGLVMSVLAAVQRNFPSYAIYQVSNADILILASNREQLPTPDWTVLRHAGISEDLARVIPINPVFLDAAWIGSSRAFAPLLATASPNSDFIPVLDLGTERTRYMHNTATGILSLGTNRFDLVAPVEQRKRDFTADPISALEVQRSEALAYGARLRMYMQSGKADTLMHVDRFDVSRSDWDALKSTLAGGPPTDWRVWISRAMKVEEDLHGGTAGVVDEAFYQQLFSYVNRNNAPAEAKAVVHFMHGLAAWNWAEVNEASGPLVTQALRAFALTDEQRRLLDDTFWISPTLLRDGVVMGRLLGGDARGAAEAYVALAPMAGTSDLRARLLESYVRLANGTK